MNLTIQGKEQFSVEHQSKMWRSRSKHIYDDRCDINDSRRWKVFREHYAVYR